MAGFYSIARFFKIFECNPREKISNMSWILNISGGFNTVTDYLTLLLPMHAVQKPQMNRGKRILVVVAFRFGICAIFSATVGFFVRLKNSASPDKSQKQPEILLWGAAELASGNLYVCFSDLTPLFRKSKTPKRPSGARRPTASELKVWREPHGSNGKLRSIYAEEPYEYNVQYDCGRGLYRTG
ncbi:hypothetical protein BU26DRAFT_593757 [Trematosphaeria pertusa]|uniref:Rhodopsin domain-containing protein n=1 Tax=Trematosphaeria pertusa TaxID=390896 RepID=A0A6A6IKQ7_9PLEO|nr:uncharacterized protein BU26DRAFT_593757 [Trematosphaeria pertusa]KAF2250073.1 hypothetical protein BU26DRAFT_593757 [Trematosphaeria pertusa]